MKMALQQYLTISIMKQKVTIERRLSNIEQLQEINERRRLIQRIRDNNLEKLRQAQQELKDVSPQNVKRPYSTSQLALESKVKHPESINLTQPIDKNAGISDTDKMLFDKKFKNYLNHRQEYIDKARNRPTRVDKPNQKRPQTNGGQAQYYNEEEILSNTGSDYQYRDASDMQAAYDQMTTGKKRKGARLALFHCQYYQNEFRRFQFDQLLSESSQPERTIASITKDRLLHYLFDEPCVMMLYSINPYQLGDDLAEYETSNKEFLNYEEFSKFLLIDREPTFFDYSRENLNQARKLGRGIKCGPIIAKWIDQNGIFEFLMDIFRQVDMHGNGKVERTFLAKKLRRQAQLRGYTERQVIQIVNINKMIPFNRILFEIEFQQRGDSQQWSIQEFQLFLKNYKRRVTPQKDRLITKLIMAGKYDSSYVFIISQQVLEIVKDIFHHTPKFAEYFVLKQKFLKNVCADSRYKKIQSMEVRSQGNKYVQKQIFAETLVRILAEGETYLDIQQILDFLTNRGRPKVVEYRVYIQNLQRQINLIEAEQKLRQLKYGQDYDGSSSDDQFGEIIKAKRINRKKNKLAAIRNLNNFSHDKKFSVTIPVPFGFDAKDRQRKVSIRQKKLKDMLDQKQKKLREEMKPIKCKQVPNFVKDSLYQKMLKQQQRQRKERLERFKLQIMSQIKVSDRLMRPKSDQLHCDFSGEPYNFIARPMPWYCEVNLLDRINRQKQERKEKILEELITRNTDYDLPQGVQRMMERQQQRQQKRAAKNRTASTGSLGECTFIPKISNGVPDFKTIHEHLHFDIQNAKNQKGPLIAVPFSFQNRPGRSRTTYQIEKKQQRHRLSKYQKVDNHQDYSNIPKTQKFQALVELRRKQLQEKKKEAEKQKNSQAVRKLREEKFAPLVRKAMKENSHDVSKSRAVIESKVKQFKREQKRKKVDYENEMIKIYTKVFQRPLLVENGGIQPERNRESKEKNPIKNQKQSQMRQSKHKAKQANEGEFLQNYGQHKPKPRSRPIIHNDLILDDKKRRAAVQQHHPGQYPVEDEQQQYDQPFHQSDVYEEQYEPDGNIHTS